MLGLLTRTKTTATVIDFGSCALRAAQLRRDGDRWRIHHWVNIEREPESAQAKPPDYTGDIALAFGPETFEGRRTALLLSPPAVEYKMLEIPRPVLDQPPHQMRESLQFELDRHMPWPASECEIAAWAIHDGQGGSTDAMVVAARTATVQGFLDMLDDARLECVAADLVPNAMIPLCGPAGAGAELWGVLDIGLQAARLYLIHRDRPVFARVVRGGGGELTETLTSALRVEFRIAEQYKRIYGVKQTDRGFRSVLGGLSQISERELPGVLYAILRSVFDAMAEEIERSYRFVLGRLNGVSAGPLYLVGGGARLPGLTHLLTDRLGVPVSLPDPKPVLDTRRVGGEGEHPACTAHNFPVLAPCVGLAMREELR